MREEHFAEDYIPPYVSLVESGEFRERVLKLYSLMKSCALCPRKCGIDRIAGEIGFYRGRRSAADGSAGNGAWGSF